MRKLLEVQQDYANLCVQIGDKAFRMAELEEQIDALFDIKEKAREERNALITKAKVLREEAKAIQTTPAPEIIPSVAPEAAPSVEATDGTASAN